MLDVNNNITEDKIFSEKNGNFQTMNMIYKIKKIKKKRKQQENIKKIPFPEVLNNINNEPEEEIKNTNESGENNPPLIEGFDRFKFVHDDWDGYDNVNDKKSGFSSKDPRQIIIDFINFCYDSTVSYNKAFAAYITDKISNNKAAKQVNSNIKSEISNIKVGAGYQAIKQDEQQGDQNKDQEIVYKFICLLEAITFSCFVVNNWYFLMFYNNFKEEGKTQVELFDFSVNRIKKLSDDLLANKIIKYILLYFIEYALFFPTNLEYYMVKVMPKFVTKILNHTLCYIFLFLVILYLSYNFASGFKHFLIDVINLNQKNFLVCLMYITVIFLFIVPDTTVISDMIKSAREEYNNMKNAENGGDGDQGNISGGNGYDSDMDIEGGASFADLGSKLSGSLNSLKDSAKFADLGSKLSGSLNSLKDSAKNAANSAANSVKDSANKTMNNIKNDLQNKANNANQFNQSAKNALKDKAFAKFNDFKNSIPKNKAEAAMTGMALVFKFLWNLIRFLIIITISVPLGGFFCLLYFVVYSIYAMLFYYDRDIPKIQAVFRDMLFFIDNKKIEIPKENPTFFQSFMKKFNEYIEYISDNFFIIVYLLAFISSLYNAQSNITNSYLRNALYVIDLTFIFSILGYLIYLIKSKFNITSVKDALEKMQSTQPLEKNYDSSVNTFITAVLSTYGLTMGGIGYYISLMVLFNK